MTEQSRRADANSVFYSQWPSWQIDVVAAFVVATSTAERGPYQAQFLCCSAFILPFVISLNIRPSPSPVYIEPHWCKLHFHYAAAPISRHLCPWQTGGSRQILHRVLCTYLAVFQDRGMWPAVVSAVANLRVALTTENYLISWGPGSFQGRTLLPGVS